MTKGLEEKRRYLRLSVPIEFEYNFLDSDKIYIAVTNDLSATGLRFVSDNALLKEKLMLELKLKLPNVQNPVHASGQVVWLNKNNPGVDPAVDVGIEIVSIEEDNKNTFLKYLCDLIYG